MRMHEKLLARMKRVAKGDRGDVPGWVMVTLMTAGLVVVLWALAEPQITALFTRAMDRLQGI